VGAHLGPAVELLLFGVGQRIGHAADLRAVRLLGAYRAVAKVVSTVNSGGLTR
jgi:hypothetical protein